MKNYRTAATAIVAVNLLIHVTALAMCGLYYARTDLFFFPDPLTFGKLVTAAKSLTLAHMRTACWSTSEFLFLGTAMIALLPVLVPFKPTAFIRAFFLMNIVSGITILVLGGGIGLYSIPLVAFSGLDGEWLGEGWPLYEAFGIWGVSCLVLAWFARREGRGREQF